MLVKMFSIQTKDGLGRLGTILTPHGKINTPVLLPVINPNHQEIPPDELIKCGAQAFITNAYLLYRDIKNREKALKSGLHDFIGFQGPIMTDSGAFQLMEYGNVSISNSEITLFQEQIQSDIGVFLDIPTKERNYQQVHTALKETLVRADNHVRNRNPDAKTLWAGPIQGGEFLDLVEQSCHEMALKDFNIHPLGSVVPYLERYNFETVIKMIFVAKKNLPSNRPIHLFGAGHPMFFAISIFLGIDIFDSAAYFLYARKNRYLTVFGTHYLDDLRYLPCSCNVCQAYTADELKQLDERNRTILLAKHNLYVSFEEINRAKQAIVEGRLNELALSRVMNHPALAKTISLLFGEEASAFIEKFTPISTSRATLFSHPILKNHPLILRYKQRIIERYHYWSPKLVISNDYQKMRSTSSYQVLKLSPLFGVIPDELKGVFPLVQHERIPMTFSEKDINYIQKFIDKFSKEFQSIEVHPNLTLEQPLSEKFESYDKYEKDKSVKKLSDKEILYAILNYQFGKDTHKLIESKDVSIQRSRKTGIIRQFFIEDKISGTVRPSDFMIIPAREFAERLCSFLPKNQLKVIASKDSIPFINQNKDLLAKFVEEVDPEIKSGEEVFIIDQEGNFLNSGRAVLSASEMLDFDHGVAVRVRK
jgi:7-cyano-7-deazaguanine tRNA-ribosyltransferase